jgi:hypothetical protein
VKRAALIGIIALAGFVFLWQLLAWMSKTESNYRPPRAGENLEDNATQTVTEIYQPRHFADGEVSQYKIRVQKGFVVLPVGSCTFTAQLIDTNGPARWRFTLKGGALAGLIHYDATSIVNAAFTHSREYHTVQKDLASRKVNLAFDEKNRVCKRSLNGNPQGEVPTEAHTLDPLSIIFKFREIDLEQSDEFSSAVCDGKATFNAKVKIIGPEKIKIGDKIYETILVEPDLGKMRGIFRKEEGAKLQIWLSADTHQTVLRIKTKIKHGTFIADLENYQREK